MIEIEDITPAPAPSPAPAEPAPAPAPQPPECGGTYVYDEATGRYVNPFA